MNNFEFKNSKNKGKVKYKAVIISICFQQLRWSILKEGYQEVVWFVVFTFIMYKNIDLKVNSDGLIFKKHFYLSFNDLIHILSLKFPSETFI